tara:strand:- start:699 stop:803 length:105 start_codon:yes stop_codon:yes gene_type:complete
MLNSAFVAGRDLDAIWQKVPKPPCGAGKGLPGLL